jgi:hypothetical protein
MAHANDAGTSTIEVFRIFASMDVFGMVFVPTWLVSVSGARLITPIRSSVPRILGFACGDGHAGGANLDMIGEQYAIVVRSSEWE